MSGFLFDAEFQAFYINLARAKGDFHGVVWNIVHEAYHVMQMAAQQRSSTSVAWITDATVPPVERLLAGTLQEGTATYVADPERLADDESVLQSVRDRYRRSTAPERLAENFAMFDAVLEELLEGRITWEDAYLKGFALSPEHEERFYFVGYEMTRAIDEHCGAECVRRLFEKHPVEFFRQYIALYTEHREIAGRFSPGTEALLEERQPRPEVPSSAEGMPIPTDHGHRHKPAS